MKKGRPRHWTDEKFEQAVRDSSCLSEMLNLLGLKGSHYEFYESHIKRLNLSTSHWLPKGKWKQVSPLAGRRKKEDLPTYSRMRLKKYLLEDQLIPINCSECGLEGFWKDKPLTLELHHIDGNSKNNALSNLCLLCPNCHSQTSTYRTKKGSRVQSTQ